MKRVVSISLGSSRRDHNVVENIGGQDFFIERIGTDGNKEKAIQLIRELDGKVDAFGMGGTDMYIYAGNKRYTFKESMRIASAAQKTPIVDGSGIKNTLERRVVKYLEDENGVVFKGKKALIVCAVDRFGLAEALVNSQCNVVFGDLLFGLGIPLPIRSLEGLSRLAIVLAPIITRMPVSVFYPTGPSQNEIKSRYPSYFEEADIIAGDFHFIRRNMPDMLEGKMVITNTITQEDEQLLKARKVKTLVTTTPSMQGRSFGTNVLEGILVVLAGKRPEDLKVEDYGQILDNVGIKPRVTHFGL